MIHKIKRGFSFFDNSDLKKTIGLSAVCFAFFVFWRLNRGRAPINNLFGAAYYIGWLLGTGLPTIIIAAQLFNSKQTQNRIVNADRDENIDFVSLYIPYLITSLLIMSVGAIAGFCLIVSSSGVFEALIYTPQLLASTLFLTILICPVCMLLSLILDDKKLTIIIGIVLFLTVTMTTGQPGFPVNYAEVAFLGLDILESAILFILVGGFENPYSQTFYVGLRFSPIQLIIPLLIWIIVSIISLWGVSRIYSLDIRRWSAESKQWVSAEVGETKPSKIITFQDELKQRRKIVTAFAFAFMLIIPITTTGYVNVRKEEWRKVVYESPAGGESVEIGEWIYGAFTGMDAPENVGLGVGCEGEVLSGGGGGTYFEFNFDHEDMSLNDLLKLNETELEDKFGRGTSGNFGSSTTFHSGRSGPIHNIQYVWVLRFLDVGGQTDGSIRISLRVVISVT